MAENLLTLSSEQRHTKAGQMHVPLIALKE
jgi:hypothetical protein